MRYFFLVLLIAITNSRHEDQPGKDSKTFIVYINYPTYSVRAEVLKDVSSIHTQEGCMYFWYSNNDIRSTENGFDGKLLHGEYRSFYPDLNLEEQGEFCYGRKTGLWKTWFPGGKIHELIHYKTGNKNGIMQVYNKEGYMISETDYKNGKKTGKEILYQDGKIDTILKYRNDELVIKKKKTKDSDSVSVSPAGKFSHKAPGYVKPARKQDTMQGGKKDREPKDIHSEKQAPGARLKKVLKFHRADTVAAKPQKPPANKTPDPKSTDRPSTK